jgi:pilus assembly protein Flp/PilA
MTVGRLMRAIPTGPDQPRRNAMIKNLVKLFKDEEGATAVEYGLIVAAIAAVIVVVVVVLGNKINNSFQKVNNAI